MRKAVNENPVVQVVVVGVLAIVVGFLLITRVMGGSENSADTASTDTAAPAAAPVAEAGAVPAEPAAEAPAEAAAGGVPVTTGAPGFEAGPGLPGDVVKAYDAGEVIVLLISKKDGIEDKRLRDEVEALRSRSDTAVFMTDSRDVARYSRIAEGVDLDRVPALAVIKPKRLTDGPLPEASVAYGFRKPESVAQAVRDALYKGRELPYHPG